MMLRMPRPPRVNGPAIKAIRQGLELTQSELAALVPGLTQPYLCRIESGMHNPSTPLVNAIAEALTVDTAELYHPAVVRRVVVVERVIADVA